MDTDSSAARPCANTDSSAACGLVLPLRGRLLTRIRSVRDLILPTRPRTDVGLSSRARRPARRDDVKDEDDAGSRASVLSRSNVARTGTHTGRFRASKRFCDGTRRENKGIAITCVDSNERGVSATSLARWKEGGRMHEARTRARRTIRLGHHRFSKISSRELAAEKVAESS